jgi:hypothetical protein
MKVDNFKAKTSKLAQHHFYHSPIGKAITSHLQPKRRSSRPVLLMGAITKICGHSESISLQMKLSET